MASMDCLLAEAPLDLAFFGTPKFLVRVFLEQRRSHVKGPKQL